MPSKHSCDQQHRPNSIIMVWLTLAYRKEDLFALNHNRPTESVGWTQLGLLTSAAQSEGGIGCRAGDMK